MAVNATTYSVNQMRNNFARETLKSGREDDQRWDFSNRPASDRLKQGTIGAQMGASANAGIRPTMNFFKKDLEQIAKSVGRRDGLLGRATSAITKYGTSSALVSQATKDRIPRLADTGCRFTRT